MLQDILAIILIYAVILISVFALIQIVILSIECVSSLLPEDIKSKSAQNQITRPSITVLVPAHNEEKVIGRALTALVPQLTVKDQLVVIADNCTDNTAKLSCQLGATVIERNDHLNRGKGYALDYGLRFIESNPPQVVAIVDADCVVQPDSINQIALEVMKTDRPVQAVYLMESAATSNPHNLISALAFKIKNLVRPTGLARLNLSCLLTGTGMAFPWTAISQVSLASGNIVEDMQLSVDLALAGNAPKFCPQAKVLGILPQKEQAANSQKKRWTHGHLKTILTQCPKLVKESIVQRRFDLFAIALDLFILPLSLLVMIWLVSMIGGLLIGILSGDWKISIISAFAGILLFISLFGTWVKFARNEISIENLLTLPWYIFKKQLPIYFSSL